jgi:uncharacterized protein (UPF0297 family)
MQNTDQKNLQNIYINLYENFEQNDSNIINDIVSFFGEENGIPEYIGKTFIAIIQNNGIENINDTYEYVNSFIKKLGMFKAGIDVVRDNTLNACIKTKEYIQRLQNS